MGYREYVEDCILESGLEETGDLLEILESAETVDDYEAIEEYLTEKKDGKGSGSVRDTLASLGRGISSGYEKTKRGAASFAADRATSRYAKNESKRAGKEHAAGNTGYIANFSGMSAAGDQAFKKVYSNFDKGTIAVGAAALLTAIAGISLKIRSAVRKANSAPAKQVERQIRELEDQANDVAKRCKKGEITAKEAKVETKKIEAQIKKLAKEAIKIARDEVANATKESVDITDLQLEIFEACESGNISEEDRDELLELLED